MKPSKRVCREKEYEPCPIGHQQRMGRMLPCEKAKGHKGDHWYYHSELICWNNKGEITKRM